MASPINSAVPIIIAGIVVWTVALVIAIIVNAVAKIIVTCLLGIALGLIGIRYTRRRAKREEG